MKDPAYQTAITEGKAYRILRAKVSESLAAFNLSMPEWTLLGQLYDTPAIRLAELATFLGVEAPLVTMLVKQLEEKGLLTMQNDPTDSRAKLITLTDRGRDILPQIEKVVRRNLEPLLVGISVEEMKTYCKVLQTVIDNFTTLKG